MRIPKVRHRKGKYLGKNLWECSDARATSESKFEGSSGGGGYLYYLHKEPNHKQKIEKNDIKIEKYVNRKAISSNEKPSERLTRTKQ